MQINTRQFLAFVINVSYISITLNIVSQFYVAGRRILTVTSTFVVLIYWTKTTRCEWFQHVSDGAVSVATAAA